MFSNNSLSLFFVLQSAPHSVWAWHSSSRLKSDLNYAPSDCLETFPFPRLDDEAKAPLEALGERYHELRAQIMRDEWIGLTKIYNRFHDPDERDPRLMNLRELQAEIDQAVATAYGWSDLRLDHDYHRVAYLPENDRLRFTVSEEARIELLHRLALLNRERYDEEVDQGLHEKKIKTTRKSTTRKKAPAKPAEPKTAAPENQPGLFSPTEENQPYPLITETSQAAEPETTPPVLDPTEAILNYLDTNPGWRRLTHITATLNLPGTEILRALNTLVAQNKIHYRTGPLERGEYRGR